MHKPKDSKIHFYLTIVWGLLILPTVLFWKDSILWISLMSVYAIISTHWGAWQAAKAEENN